MRTDFRKEASTCNMAAPHFPAPVPGQRHTGLGKQRTMIVIILSATIAMFGSITLTTDASWHYASSHRTTSTPVSRSTAVATPAHTPTLKPTLTPTQAPVHTPQLGYPLFYGNSHLPEIALTFDDGPNPYYTSQVLAVLQQHRVKATFFDVGYLVADYPNIVRQEYNQGNVVGNHSWSHPELTLLSASAIRSQIASTSTAIQTAIGVKPTLFRPPYGSMNHTVLAEAYSLGVTTVLWDASAGDWSLPGVSVIVYRILHYVHNGAIILLHDGGGNRAQTVAALPTLISTLENQGFSFVTIPQLIDDLATSSPHSGVSKHRATTRI